MRPASILVATALMLWFAGSASAADTKAPAGQVILTVAGAVENTNRPAYDGKRDVFLKYHEQDFDRAFEFDRAALEGLGVVEIRVEHAGWDGPKTLSGPRLADVLGAAGCGAGPIATLALDGFATELPRERIAAHEWVLATRANGRPHDIGGRGPLWLVYDPPGDRPATDDEEGTWPWAVFFIRCG